MTAPAAPRIAELRVYPVKSLAGATVGASAVDDLGLALDRRWMLVDAAGCFLTQRVHPRMALASAVATGDGGIVVTAPGRVPLVVHPTDDAPRRRVRVWEDEVDAATYPAGVDAWFSAFLGFPASLVYMPDDVVRPVDATYGAPGDRASFADGFPLLLLSRESVDGLNARLMARGASPVDVRRFRPNILLEGVGEAHAEDGWRAFRAGDVRFDVVKPCARCVLTTVDPDRGEKGVEPLRTLSTYRKRDGKVLFAQNVIPRGRGILRVGDAVQPLA